MASAKDALRRQRRRELDARRSKSRIRLGSCLESWGNLKEALGFSLHSEFAQYLLESYFSKVCTRCSGDRKEVTIFTTADSLQQLVLLVHSHAQQCPLQPTVQAGPVPKCSIQASSKGSAQVQTKACIQADPKSSIEANPEAFIQFKSSIDTGSEDSIQSDPNESIQTCEVEESLKYVCKGGHAFTWCPIQRESQPQHLEGRPEKDQLGQQETAVAPEQKSITEQGKKRVKDGKMHCVKQHKASSVRTRSLKEAQTVTSKNTTEANETEGMESIIPQSPREDEEPLQHLEQDMGSQEGSDTVHSIMSPKNRAPSPSLVPNSSKRGRQRRVDQLKNNKADHLKTVRRKRTRQESVKDDVSQISGKRKRKVTPKLILPCEFDGCWKVFSSRQYLNHHMKYQHFQQKTFACSHPSCGKSFNFKKHLKEHEKLHSDQRDYICEFCARAFRTSSNLSIHRRIHTGEKPLQCEVCGFTCRQKASLNWHMRKHDAESSYRFPCEICGRRFEKRDNVTAHRSKSHPELLTPSMDSHSPIPAGQESDTKNLTINFH